jgi:hypothetical protein
MSIRLYKAKVSVMRDRHTRLFVYDYMIAARDRKQARTIALDRAYTYDSDWTHVELECITGAAYRLGYKLLESKP